MKALYVFIIILLSAFSNSLLSQTSPITAQEYSAPDSCLKFPGDYKEFFNPDSVKIDSCQFSVSFGKYYSKYGFIFSTNNYPFTSKPISAFEKKNWRDIDSQFVSQRFGFELIEQIFGSYTLRRDPDSNDSMHLLYPVFILDFSEYQLVDSVLFYIRQIDSINGAKLQNWPVYMSIDTKYLKQFDTSFCIMAQPNINQLIIKSTNEHNLEELNIEIFDLIGNCLQKNTIKFSTVFTIDISTFNSGFYVLRVNNQTIIFRKY